MSKRKEKRTREIYLRAYSSIFSGRWRPLCSERRQSTADHRFGQMRQLCDNASARDVCCRDDGGNQSHGAASFAEGRAQGAAAFAKSSAAQKGNYRKHRRRADFLLYSGSPGPGLAKSVIDWAITFFDNGVVIVENRENKDPSIVSFGAEADSTPSPTKSGADVNTVDDTEHYYYSSIEEFIEQFGKNPFILDNPEARLKSLRYNKSNTSGVSSLVSIYDYRGHDLP